jgi:hypothetical protein
MKHKRILEKIDCVIDALAVPVSASEAADGWTPESKKAVKRFFESLKQTLQSDAIVPDMNIARALDHWGIISGDILEQSAQISNELRESQRFKSGHV